MSTLSSILMKSLKVWT